jgi:hypothetical protein
MKKANETYAPEFPHELRALVHNINIIYSPNSAFGGYEYRAIEVEGKVMIQERGPNSNSFKTKRSMSYAGWNKFATDFDISNPYCDNPAHISKLVDSYYHSDDGWCDNYR